MSRGAAATLPALALCVLATACKPPEPASTKPAAAGVATGAAVDLPLGPLSRHDQACARCHGPQGMFHGERFRQLGPAELAAEIDRMWTQTALLPPAPAEQAAMLAYHRALQARRPFVCLTNAASFYAGRDSELRGEVTPDSTHRVLAGGRELPAALDGQRFRVAECPRVPLSIRVRRGTVEVVLEAPANTWSE